MTDETQQAPEASGAKEVEITISTPDRWTYRAFQIYTDGQLAYRSSLKEGTAYAEALARFNGAVALIRAGIVHVKAPDAVRQLWERSDLSDIDIALIGIFLREIAGKIERSFGDPFLAS